ncbi:MAG: iron-sulfur cluster assembly scaffold protein [Candidatus Woesearchaeota archaeon]
MEYTNKVLEIFQNPKNIGEIKDADAIGKVGNPTCGDLMWLYLKFEDINGNNKIIKDAKVKTFGCVAAVATSSILTEMIIGKTLDDAKKITKEDIVNELGGLPKPKIHCSLLALDALKDAIKNYEQK